jgi:hypothetical protein
MYVTEHAVVCSQAASQEQVTTYLVATNGGISNCPRPEMAVLARTMQIKLDMCKNGSKARNAE